MGNEQSRSEAECTTVHGKEQSNSHRECDSVHIFHDSENCYIPSCEEKRDPSGKIMTNSDGLVSFGPNLKVDGAVIYQEVVRNAVACVVGAEAAKTLNVRNIATVYNFVHNGKSNKFSAPVSTIGEMGDMGGFINICGNGKPDGVDVKIKELLSSKIAELNSFPAEQKSKILFVILSGDRDFSPEIKQAKTSGFQVAVIHSADSPLRSSMVKSLDPGFSPCCWLDIVAAARKAKGNSYYHPLAPDPNSPFMGTVSAETPRILSVPAPVASSQQKVPEIINLNHSSNSSYVCKLFCRFKLTYRLQDHVQKIHQDFFLNPNPRACCDLSYNVYEGTNSPTFAQIREAKAFLQKAIDDIELRDMTLHGVTILDLMNNTRIKQLGAKYNVFFHYPEYKKDAEMPAIANVKEPAPNNGLSFFFFNSFILL
jgi:hypothetical protein